MLGKHSHVHTLLRDAGSITAEHVAFLLSKEDVKKEKQRVGNSCCCCSCGTRDPVWSCLSRPEKPTKDMWAEGQAKPTSFDMSKDKRLLAWTVCGQGRNPKLSL